MCHGGLSCGARPNSRRRRCSVFISTSVGRIPPLLPHPLPPPLQPVQRPISTAVSNHQPKRMSVRLPKSTGKPRRRSNLVHRPADVSAADDAAAAATAAEGDDDETKRAGRKDDRQNPAPVPNRALQMSPCNSTKYTKMGLDYR